VLIDEPCSGYDLSKRFEGSVGFFWRASFQQIYRELTKLEEQGLLQALAIHQDSRPDKKIYSVTEAGREYLSDWIAQPAEMNSIKDELLVKLFAGHLVSQQTLLAELARHRQRHVEQLSVYQAIEKQYFQDLSKTSTEGKFRYLTLRHGIRYETEWLNWCDEVVQFLQTSITN